MKIKTIAYSLALFASVTLSTATASETNIVKAVFSHLPSSPIANTQTTRMDNEFLSCKTDSMTNDSRITTQSRITKAADFLPKSLKYLNDIVQVTYNTMRNGVIRYVTKEVALSLFNFNVDGFAAKNIAHYVSDGTQPYLPFEFANGVKITKVTPKGGTIIYRAEMPMTKHHQYAAQLALAGKASAKNTICNDMEMVDDLLGRHIVIQYDYYDANGDFFSSFTING